MFFSLTSWQNSALSASFLFFFSCHDRKLNLLPQCQNFPPLCISAFLRVIVTIETCNFKSAVNNVPVRSRRKSTCRVEFKCDCRLPVSWVKKAWRDPLLCCSTPLEETHLNAPVSSAKLPMVHVISDIKAKTWTAICDLMSWSDVKVKETECS